MNNKTGSSVSRGYTFNQFVTAMSWFFYGEGYGGCRWKRQGEQGYCWWDKKTQSYIDTSQLFECIIECMKHYNPDWTVQ